MSRAHVVVLGRTHQSCWTVPAVQVPTAEPPQRWTKPAEPPRCSRCGGLALMVGLTQEPMAEPKHVEPEDMWAVDADTPWEPTESSAPMITCEFCGFHLSMCGCEP